MSIAQPVESSENSGLHTLVAEFHTEHYVGRARFVTLEWRLSDHLNSSAPSVEMRLSSVDRDSTGAHFTFADSHARLEKASVLLVVPLEEPPRPAGAGNKAWKRTATRKCWIALGRYRLTGLLHTETLFDPQRTLRVLDQRQFQPVTNATLSLPDGTTRELDVVLFNRAHADLIALPDAF